VEFFVPLISAAIAGLVALVVTQRQGRSARENWVLDRRFSIYGRVLDASVRFLGQFDRTEALQAVSDATKVTTFLGELVVLDLIAPKVIRDHASFIARLTWDVNAGRTDVVELIKAVDTLVDMLRDDLVPPRLR
jgi:hypothetical protein